MKKIVLLSVAGVLVAAGIIIGMLLSKSKSEIVYVDLNKLYTVFSMRKELESKLKNVKSVRQHQLDSVKLILEAQAKILKEKDIHSGKQFDLFDQMRQDYMLKNRQFDEDNKSLASQYYEQVISQLNQYIKDYGKTHHYRLILGAKGDGNVMYAETDLDITPKVQEYIDNAYNGRIK